MKRYRLHWSSFDTRATILNFEIQDEWDEMTKKSWIDNKNGIIQGLKLQYWEVSIEVKITNFKEFWTMPLSVIYYHNSFFFQIREAFVMGAYYPALTWVCSLGERILNHLINELKDDFKSYTALKGYKNVYKKSVFKSDDWESMIDILAEWKVFEKNVVDKFLQLKDIRNIKAVHFNIEMEDINKLREVTLDSIKLMCEIIDLQFWWLGSDKKWLIEWTAGVFFIKKSYESDPFVKNIIIPNCVLVGNMHRIETINWRFIFIDDYPYSIGEITDEEFAKSYL